MSSAKIADFEKFLESKGSDGKRYGQIIKEALIEYEKGVEEYNDILAVLDQPEWVHIKLEDIIRLKEHVLRHCSINTVKPLKILGWLGGLFGAEDTSLGVNEKICGAVYLQKNSNHFYSNLQINVAIEVYCYPNLTRVPVYQAQSDHKAYSTPKNIELVDTGCITLYIGEEPVQIKTNNKMTRIKLEINLDGNQNILVTAGSETHLIT